MRRVLLWGPALAYMAVIFYSSSQSDPVPALTHLVWDKLLHAAGYALLAILYARALRGEGASALVVALLAAVFTSLYAASDEWHQSFVAMRTSDVRDWIADTIGGIAGVAAFAFATACSRP
jgi:VanZ family protein